MKRFFVIILLCAVIGEISAQQNERDTATLVDRAAGLAEYMLDLVTWEKERYIFSIYPMAGYSPRTGAEIGLMPVLRILPKKQSDSPYFRPTTIAPSFQVSTTGMYELQFDVVAFSSRQFYVISRMQYLFLPDSFYGLDNGDKEPPYSDYELNHFGFRGDFLKGWKDKYFIGVRSDINYNENNNITGDLLHPGILGYAGGWANGMGPVLTFDNRDDLLYPTRGWYVSASTMWYTDKLGSDYDFNTLEFDVRHYLSLRADKSIVAFQGYMNLTYGDVPFFKRAFLGGKRLLRGIPHPHKYLDQHAWYVQGEYRQHIWWRLGATAFAGVGNVFGDLNNNLLNDAHVAGGLGLRFRVLPDDGLNFRIDYGMTNRGDNALYFTIREAF